MLSWAWEDLDDDDTHPSYYWKDATKLNIESIVVKVANDWIAKNKEHYIQPEI